jgi:hypothetical protein
MYNNLFTSILNISLKVNMILIINFKRRIILKFLRMILKVEIFAHKNIFIIVIVKFVLY